MLLLERVLHWPVAAAGAAIGLLAVVVLTLPQFGLRESYLLTLSGLLTALAVNHGVPLALVLSTGLAQATFLMAFIALLALLYEAASLSPSVRHVGQWLASQPGGRRFTALFWGTDIMGVLFNLGVVSLLTPLIDREDRRQSGAILRGIAWTVVWAPTALAPIAVMELIEGIDRQRWTLLGLALTALVFATGWLEDFLRHGSVPIVDRTVPARPTPWRSLLAFTLTLLVLAGLVAVFNVTIQGGYVLSLMIACPILMLGWLGVQTSWQPPAWRTAVHRLVTTRLPVTAKVAVSLACSGYIGRVAALLIPDRLLTEVLPLDSVPTHWLLFAIPLVMIALSWLALSPIMLAVFFGSVFGSLPVLPADPTLIALAISAGWALSMTSSPFATVVLLMSGMLEQRGTALSLYWHWRFNLAVLPVLYVFFRVAAGPG